MNRVVDFFLFKTAKSDPVSLYKPNGVITKAELFYPTYKENLSALVLSTRLGLVLIHILKVLLSLVI